MLKDFIILIDCSRFNRIGIQVLGITELGKDQNNTEVLLYGGEA